VTQESHVAVGDGDGVGVHRALLYLPGSLSG